MFKFYKLLNNELRFILFVYVNFSLPKFYANNLNIVIYKYIDNVYKIQQYIYDKSFKFK